MKSIFETLAAVMLSVGGAGAIIFGLSSWLGKVWASRILEKEKAEYSKNIELYKSQLEIELAKINVVNEKAVFVTKLQYEKEFSIYLELWEDIFECVQATLQLYPTLENVPTDEEKKQKFEEEKYTAYVKDYNKFIKTMNKYAPFYAGLFDQLLDDIRNDCSEIGRIYRTYKIDAKYSTSFAMARDITMTPEQDEKVYLTLPESIKSNQDKLKIEIRDYLQGLQTMGQN